MNVNVNADTVKQVVEAEKGNPQLTAPTYLLLSAAWNDALEWAEPHVKAAHV